MSQFAKGEKSASNPTSTDSPFVVLRSHPWETHPLPPLRENSFFFLSVSGSFQALRLGLLCCCRSTAFDRSDIVPSESLGRRPSAALPTRSTRRFGRRHHCATRTANKEMLFDSLAKELLQKQIWRVADLLPERARSSLPGPFQECSVGGGSSRCPVLLHSSECGQGRNVRRSRSRIRSEVGALEGRDCRTAEEAASQRQ